MPDDKSAIGKADRDRVAGGEGYEVSFFAEKHNISTAEAEQLIKRHGNDREKLDAEADKLAKARQ